MLFKLFYTIITRARKPMYVILLGVLLMGPHTFGWVTTAYYSAILAPLLKTIWLKFAPIFFFGAQNVFFHCIAQKLWPAYKNYENIFCFVRRATLLFCIVWCLFIGFSVATDPSTLKAIVSSFWTEQTKYHLICSEKTVSILLEIDQIFDSCSTQDLEYMKTQGFFVKTAEVKRNLISSFINLDATVFTEIDKPTHKEQLLDDKILERTWNEYIAARKNYPLR